MKVFRAFAIALLAVLGAVQLSGCASSPDQRATGQVIDDAAITGKVKAALAREADFTDAMDVNVTTYRGVVQLSGFVDSEQMARRASSIAQRVDGVQSVKNDLRVAAK